MRCNIHGDRIEITPALKEYVESKLTRLEKYDFINNNDDCRVTLRVTRKKHIVEVTIPTPGAIFRAEESSDDMYASIDLVIDKLNRQIRKYKNRVENKSRQLVSTPTTTSIRDEDMDELVRIKHFEYKPMNVDEAIMQMDLLGHTFFVFANAQTGQVNVVYKRNDGGYGMIAPSYR